jgi:16S rRNA (guanine527-N7)-methyltransferase
LVELSTMLARWAARMNLTGHRSAESIARRLVLDALALGETLPERPPASLVDLGSGAGFPGLPLGICWPRCRVTLVEARERRHHFQRAAVRDLNLSNVTPVRGRIEDLAPLPHAVVVAQALAEPARALAWMVPWVEPAGWLALPRSPRAPSPHGVPGFEAIGTRTYRVPLGGPERELWLARRAFGGRVAGGCGT